jgi:hypothetical protein
MQLKYEDRGFENGFSLVEPAISVVAATYMAP